MRNASSPAPEPGDGFTAAEVDTVRHASTNETWTPVEDYEDVDISSLVAGLRRVSFMGRVVNLFDQSTPSKTPRAAKGCIKIIVKDDAGKLMVRLLWSAWTCLDQAELQISCTFYHLRYRNTLYAIKPS